MPPEISTIVAVVSALVAIASWTTSARKSRVDNLCRIIDQLRKHIDELEEDLARAKVRITELERENHRYRMKLIDASIDPDGEPDAT
jgi:hypothetical protein